MKKYEKPFLDLINIITEDVILSSLSLSEESVGFDKINEVV